MVFGLSIGRFEAEGRETCEFLGVFRLSEMMGLRLRGGKLIFWV